MLTLLAIQTELKCSKDKYNKFGGFSYRNCEDILEAAKPILAKYDALLTLTDDLVQFGDKIFLKATATLKVDGETYTATGFAMIGEKKGMDAAPQTGSASSYARKYALGALFLLDNEKDPDAEEPPTQQAPTSPTQAPTPPPPPPMRGSAPPPPPQMVATTTLPPSPPAPAGPRPPMPPPPSPTAPTGAKQ